MKWQCWGQYLGAKAGAGPNGLKGLFFRWLGTDARRDDVGICSRNVKRREKALQEHAAKQSDPKILEACEQALAAMQKAAR